MRTPRTPLPSISSPVAAVLTRTSAPAPAARSASTRSNTRRSRMYPRPPLARTVRVSPSATVVISAWLTSAAIQRGSGSMKGASCAWATPSAQRTGEPISWRFSSSSTESPAWAATWAAVAPPGPAPTTTTS